MESRLNIRVLGLPGACFDSAEVLAEFRTDAEAYEAVAAAFDAGALDIAEFWEELQGLGFEYDEIQWHLGNPGKRMTQGYLVGAL